MKLTNEEYLKIKEICLKEYLLRPNLKFLAHASFFNKNKRFQWSVGSSWLNEHSFHSAIEDYFNTNFISNKLINDCTDNLIILMQDDLRFPIKFPPLKALKIGRVMIIRKDAEIKIITLS